MFNTKQLEVLAFALERLLKSEYDGLDKSTIERTQARVAEFQRGDVIADVWSIEDVQGMIDEDGGEAPVTVEEAREVLESALDNHDANYGLTWDGLKDILDEIRSEEEVEAAASLT